MKKITFLFLFLSFTGFSQQSIIQNDLSNTDNISTNRPSAIRQIFDRQILKNISINNDTINLNYSYIIQKNGVIKLDSILSTNLKIKKEIKNFFTNSNYSVKPYIDLINGSIDYHDKNQLSYYLKDNKLEFIDVSILDKFPIFPNCVGDNETLKRCMNRMISKHIARKFNIDLANSIGLKDGKHRIYVRFIIDKTGTIINVEAKAPHPILKDEAIRIIKLLPIIEPGISNDKKVKVSFQIPITFTVV